MACVFCEIRRGGRPSTPVTKNRRAFAIMDIHPLSDGHTLVIPNAHVETIDALADEDLLAVSRLVRRVAVAIRRALLPEGLTILQLNGSAAHQSVPHFHVHVIPRWLHDDIGFDWPLLPGDPERIRQAAEKVRAAL